MITAILTILGFILPLLEDYFHDKKNPTYTADKERFNRLLAGGDNLGLSAMFEQLHRPDSDSNPSRPGDNKTS